MEKKQFIDALFARALEVGFEACEVYYSTSSSFNTDVLKGEILKYSASDSIGLGFRGLYNGRMGYASTQILDEEAIDLLIDGARTNAELVESEDPQFLYPGDSEYAEVNAWNPALNDVSASDKIEMARKLENLTMGQDARIEQVEGCTILSADGETTIVNTLGLNVSARSNMIGGYVGPIARDGDKVNSGFAYFLTLNPDEIDLNAVAAEAAEDALSGLDAVQPGSGKMSVVLRNTAAADLLETFAGVFSAESAQKGLSLLAGREGEVIAADCVTLVDNPHLAGSVASTPFDGEGVATSAHNVVERGALTTLLHNLKTARKQGVRSTGNASRGYASTVSVAPTNFYFLPSETPLDALLAQLGDGLMITEVTGLHAGANPISGDFSLSAKGYRIQGGKPVEAVKQFTVAGNFYQLLKDVAAVGSDLKFGFPSASHFGSPSLLIRTISVGGAD